MIIIDDGRSCKRENDYAPCMSVKAIY